MTGEVLLQLQQPAQRGALASKGALLAIMRTLAVTLGPDGIAEVFDATVASKR